jgi:hypothetical protein
MEPLIKALTQFETLMNQSRETLEIIARSPGNQFVTAGF